MMHKTKSRKSGTLGDAPSRPLPVRLITIVVVSVVLMICGGLLFADWWTCLPEGTQPSYVGRQSCVQCHSKQVQHWTGSHHDLAMDLATDMTVLGDFDDAELTHFGITSRMYRAGGKFMVHTEGPDGKLTDFPVKYVFGVEPLQQYLVEFDRPAEMPENENARLQVLRISWDTQQKKWFYLSPPDVDESVERLSPDDDLHWTGVAQRWNNMCADCHSTNLQKNFDAKSKTYHTTFSEIDVSCEACHGPGSTHVQLANSKSLFWDRKLGYGLAKLKSENADIEIHTCAKCHSRRRVVHPDFRPGENYYDYFDNERLNHTTYHADGQILDEVYVYGSFIQSKMYHKSIRCTDCHDPHTARLKHEGNKVCTSCHTHPEAKYDTVNHHHHKNGSTGALCVECHMPETTYMDVDPRRDHSLRIPRPDLSVKIGTPNACTRCHLDESKITSEKRGKLKQYADWLLAARDGDEEIKAELARLDRWSSENVTTWFGDKYKDEKHFSLALAKAREGEPEAETPLLAVAIDRKLPAIVRATALFELSGFDTQESFARAHRSIKDPHPHVRAGALARYESQIATLKSRVSSIPRESVPSLFEPIVNDLLPLLDDDTRLVRTEAARVLAGVPPSSLGKLTSSPQRKSMRDALGEFIEGVMVNNDRAGAYMSLGILYQNLGNSDAAIEAYETATEIEPNVTGPRSNLSALYNQLADDADRRAQQAIRQGDREAMKRWAKKFGEFGEKAIRLKHEELVNLKRDARLAPDNAAVQYQYGLVLSQTDEPERAEQYLLKAYQLSPRTPIYVIALAYYYEKYKRWTEAVKFAEELIRLRPENQEFQRLLEDYRRQASPTAGPTGR